MMTAGSDHRRRVAVGLALGVVLGAATVGAVVTAEDEQSDSTVISAEDGPAPTTVTAATAAPAAADPAATPAGLVLPDLEGDLGQNEVEPTAPIEPERADGGCTIGALSVRLTSQGDGVACLQQALAEEGLYDGEIDGDFDDATLSAVLAYQEQAGLFVDGVVGRESAIELGIWPDEESLVVRTAPPAPDTYDSTGYLLSPVASMGDAAPPLPENSGSGRRVVYDRAGQRVWAVDENEQIVRSWLVSGSKFSNEEPGTHTVYSKSEMSTAWNGQAFLPNMIRYQETDIGHIGFHGIPRHVSDNSPYQTTEELGTRLSGGCQRQHDLDAEFLWAFADIGTTVVVT
jgi:peptidoglycan hydrolase-like protein with peptidoglycan-binding domain